MTQLEKTQLEQKFDFFKKAQPDKVSLVYGVVFMASGFILMVGGAMLAQSHQPYDLTKGTFVKINDLSK